MFLIEMNIFDWIFCQTLKTNALYEIKMGKH